MANTSEPKNSNTYITVQGGQLIPRSSLKRPYTKIILALASITILFACLRSSNPEITSTSVTTGNPAGIRIKFEKSSIPILISGKIEIFAATQIPVSGYSPAPLFEVELSAAESVEIKALSIYSIPDSLWPAKSIEGDSLRSFNVVISGDSLGLILEGMSLRKAKEDFAFSQFGEALPIEGFQAKIVAELSPLTDYVGKTDTNRLSISHNYYLFIFGTGFVAKGDKGVFKIPHLPIGHHNAFFLPLPYGDRLLFDYDSTFIFGINGGLNTGLDSLYRGSIIETIELPDSLKSK